MVSYNEVKYKNTTLPGDYRSLLKEIREKMFVEKYEAKSKSYLQEVRKAAMIEYR